MKIGFFVTCLVDLMRPKIGFDAVALIEKSGCRVSVPEAQTCCGQPAWNSGDVARTIPIARQVVNAFAPFDYVVAPSGSCAGMIREHYVELFEHDLKWRQKARDLAARTYELTAFLHDVLDARLEPRPGRARIAYHDSCAGLRELGVRRQPRALLSRVGDAELIEIEDGAACCGFGGTFCVKYSEVSVKMADDKLDGVRETGAEVLLGGDLGCLLHLAGRMRRIGRATRVYHVAEWLAGTADDPGIAAPARAAGPRDDAGGES